MPLTRETHPYVNFDTPIFNSNAAFSTTATLTDTTIRGILNIVKDATPGIPNFNITGNNEQTFRFYNTNTTGTTRTSWKMASRIDPDWSWIWYTDYAANGLLNDLVLANKTANPFLYFSADARLGIRTVTPSALLHVNNQVAGTTPSIIQGAAGQTGNLTEWWNSANTLLTYVRNDGYVYSSLGIGGGPFVHSGLFLANTQLSSVSSAITNVGLLVRGASGQTADLVQIQNSTPSTLVSINASGNYTATFANPRVTLTNNSGTSTTAQLGADSGAGYVGTTTANTFSVVTNNTARITLASDGTLTTISTPVAIDGNLTVNGTTTTINSSTLTVDDKNIEMGAVVAATVSTTGTVGSITGTGPWTATITGMTDTADLVVGSAITATNGTGSLGAGGTYIVASIVSASSITYTATGGTTPVGGTVTNISTTGATNVTANGGGIILKGATDKSILWDSTNANWTSSENFNIVTGKTLKINNVALLSETSLTMNTISATAVSSVATLWSTITTGSIGIGAGITTGSINIGTATTFNGTVTIGSGAGTVNKTITIGTASTSGTTTISIGSISGATSNVTIFGIADGTTTTATRGAGYMGMPQRSTSTSGSFSAADAGKHIYVTATGTTQTIPANGTVAFPIGTTIVVVNASGVSTSIAITTDTLRLANSASTGTRTLASNGMCTLLKIAATTWIASGNGLT